jgi:cell fate (sporulation/competence/biofilm development) regulator YmcA (YheA/YmcA/DUF963 family)
MTPAPSTGHQSEKAVFRNLALPVSVFDHIKDVQRAQEALQGHRMTICQTVSHIVREHQRQAVTTTSAQREGRTTNEPAIFLKRQ